MIIFHKFAQDIRGKNYIITPKLQFLQIIRTQIIFKCPSVFFKLKLSLTNTQGILWKTRTHLWYNHEKYRRCVRMSTMNTIWIKYVDPHINQISYMGSYIWKRKKTYTKSYFCRSWHSVTIWSLIKNDTGTTVNKTELTRPHLRGTPSCKTPRQPII